MESKTCARYFSKSEIRKLEEGLPSLSKWSRFALVPFVAHRILRPKITWINRRWFLERGFDLTIAAEFHRVSAWLLDDFAWSSSPVSQGVMPQTRMMWADRYGSSEGRSPHGGSGRVATIGCFQAKGIGQTPLVGMEAPAGHAHGCQSLSECIREAIWAEIAAAEFPHGAVPVIAVIDTAMSFSSPDSSDRYDQNVRRGILVRPSVVRPAHAQRAPLFKHSVQTFTNVQSHDVQRTREIISYWTALLPASARDVEFNTLAQCIRFITEQIAFGQVHRLFSGGYFSSNVSIHGELLDFGNMHALPNWARAQVHSAVPGLGDEMEALVPLVSSLAFYFTKYQQRGDSKQLTADLLAIATDTYANAWRHYSLAIFQADGLSLRLQDCLHDLLREYFRKQQRHRVKYRFGIAAKQGAFAQSGWIYDALVAEHFLDASPEQRLLSLIAEQIVINNGVEQLELSLITASRLLMPRPSVDRRQLLDTLAAIVPRSDDAGAANIEDIEQLVRVTVSEARRNWPRLPPGFGVLAHTWHHGSSALLCAEQRDGPWSVWLEGVRCPATRLHWCEQRFDESDFSGLPLYCEGLQWSVICPVREVAVGAWRAVLRHGEMDLPKMDVWYSRPSTRWAEVKRV